MGHPEYPETQVPQSCIGEQAPSCKASEVQPQKSCSQTSASNRSGRDPRPDVAH